MFQQATEMPRYAMICHRSIGTELDENSWCCLCVDVECMCSCSPFHIPLSSPEHQGIHFRDVAIILPGILFSFDFLLYDFWLFIPLYYFYQLDDQVMKSTTFL